MLQLVILLNGRQITSARHTGRQLMGGSNTAVRSGGWGGFWRVHSNDVRLPDDDVGLGSGGRGFVRGLQARVIADLSNDGLGWQGLSGAALFLPDLASSSILASGQRKKDMRLHATGVPLLQGCATKSAMRVCYCYEVLLHGVLQGSCKRSGVSDGKSSRCHMCRDQSLTHITVICLCVCVCLKLAAPWVTIFCEANQIMCFERE